MNFGIKMNEKITDVCIRWQSDSPFFAEFLLRFKYIEDPKAETCAVCVRNGRIHLKYAPEFIEKLKPIELEAVMMHEIMHILNRFFERLGDRNLEIFNIAQDAVINETIETSTIGGRTLVLPCGVKMKEIKEMGYKGESISEPVYDFMYSKANIITIKSNGGGGYDAFDKDGKKIFSTTDNHEKMSSDRLTEMDKQTIEEVINHAKSRSWGTISGNLKSKCEQLLKGKEIPWREKLRTYLSRYVNEPGNIQISSWSKRNRRNLPFPGVKRLANKVILSMDTSMSISNKDIEKFFYQIEKIVKDFSNLIIIEWDTKVQRHYTYHKGDWKKIEVTGRGGTDCQDLYDYVKKNLKEFALMLVNFTDGCFDLRINNYNIPTIWAVVNNKDFKPNFGKVVIIDE